MFTNNIPDVIGNANVLCYAVINLTTPTNGTQHFLNGKLQGLAICRYKPNEGFYLFYCDDKCNEFADTWHETIDDAKDQAEYEYAGITNNWNYK